MMYMITDCVAVKFSENGFTDSLYWFSLIPYILDENGAIFDWVLETSFMICNMFEIGWV